MPLLALLICLGVRSSAGQTKSVPGDLRIYFVDTEGGQATLFVFPSGTSLLVDTGFPRPAGRDSTRILRAAKLAGLERIDYVLITHYHVDHVGGLPQLIEKIPVGTIIDHGENHEPDVPATRDGYDGYQKLLATGNYKHITVKPGDKLPIPDADITVVSSDGAVLTKPLPGMGKANAACAAPDAMPADIDLTKDVENGRSVGFEVNFGKLRILDLGDLTWDRERPLMCPVNEVGHINLLVVSHHGSEPSSSPVLVAGLAAQVAIMDNGERKGGVVRVLDAFHNAPGKPDLWQLHFAAAGGADHNSDPALIANLLSPEAAAKQAAEARAAGPPPPAAGPGPRGGSQRLDEGYMITVDAHANGAFKVTNERTGQSRDYVAH